MDYILDRIGSQGLSFTPATALEYVALRLAHKLSDLALVRHYVTLMDRHGLTAMLNAYHRALVVADQSVPMAVRFHKVINEDADL